MWSLSPTGEALPSPLDRARRVLFCHAHPDDETLWTGALIAWLSRHGVRCDVVTATRGERGGVVRPLSRLMGSRGVAARRRRELDGAMKELGVAHHAYLGTPPARTPGQDPTVYPDSGLTWVTPTQAGRARDADVDCFSLADISAEVSDLVAAVDSWRPDLLVTYDASGGYGHVDHVRMHHVTVATGRATGVGVLEIIPPGRREDFPDGQWLDLASELPTVRKALRHHTSQLMVVGNEVVHRGGPRQPIGTLIGLRVHTPE